MLGFHLCVNLTLLDDRTKTSVLVHMEGNDSQEKGKCDDDRDIGNSSLALTSVKGVPGKISCSRYVEVHDCDLCLYSINYPILV